MKNSKGYDFKKIHERNRREAEKRRERIVVGMGITFSAGCVVFALMFLLLRLAQVLGIEF
ncbi:hypothetical protein PVS_25 [Vibrio phage vB_VspS_VS-ABTNL-3]|nr:hypothetical protein PVS_25 [Vibrio phage vB_VspS_VS-ABTNL-3]